MDHSPKIENHGDLKPLVGMSYIIGSFFVTPEFFRKYPLSV